MESKKKPFTITREDWDTAAAKFEIDSRTGTRMLVDLGSHTNLGSHTKNCVLAQAFIRQFPGVAFTGCSYTNVMNGITGYYVRDAGELAMAFDNGRDFPGELITTIEGVPDDANDDRA